MNKLDTHTQRGNTYVHDTKSRSIENGNYVWLYICHKELKKEWNKRSRIKYNEKDNKGNTIKYTLIRYLASKGFHKDADGVLELTNEDVESIEKGIANYIYTSKIGLYPKFYQVIWEVDNYIRGNNPSGHSVTQRIEYYKSAYHIFKENILIGVGTGDLKIAYNDYYNKSNSILEKKWRLRAHNQYLTFLVAFGVIGFLWIMFSLFAPIYFEQGFRSYLFFIFFAIAFLSMINEDTLETQTGATFFAYF